LHYFFILFRKKNASSLSTILYISDYKESTAPNFFVGSGTAIARLDENDSIQTFNITTFYPIDPSTPCYIPKLTNNQVISVNNCKFSLGNNNEINVKIFLFCILIIFFLLLFSINKIIYFYKNKKTQ
jgi:hypothetical protein